MFNQHWEHVQYEYQQHKGSDVQLLRIHEDDKESLEDHLNQCSRMFGYKYLDEFEHEVMKWNKQFAAIRDVTALVGEIQRTWLRHQNEFFLTEEVKKQLPEESETFVKVDEAVKRILKDAYDTKNCLKFCVQDDILFALEDIEALLQICEKALKSTQNL